MTAPAGGTPDEHAGADVGTPGGLPRFNLPAIATALLGAAMLAVSASLYPVVFVLAPVAVWTGVRGLRLARERRGRGRALSWWGLTAVGVAYVLAVIAATVAFSVLSDVDVRHLMESPDPTVTSPPPGTDSR